MLCTIVLYSTLPGPVSLLNLQVASLRQQLETLRGGGGGGGGEGGSKGAREGKEGREGREGSEGEGGCRGGESRGELAC